MNKNTEHTMSDLDIVFAVFRFTIILFFYTNVYLPNNTDDDLTDTYLYSMYILCVLVSFAEIPSPKVNLANIKLLMSYFAMQVVNIRKKLFFLIKYTIFFIYNTFRVFFKVVF
jgi:hypothetical protein